MLSSVTILSYDNCRPRRFCAARQTTNVNLSREAMPSLVFQAHLIRNMHLHEDF